MKHELGPLPEPEWLANAYTQAFTADTVSNWPASNAARFTKPLYTADQMHAYATQEVAAAVAPLEAEIQRLRAEVKRLFETARIVEDWRSGAVG